jgi:hypothetical protein
MGVAGYDLIKFMNAHAQEKQQATTTNTLDAHARTHARTPSHTTTIKL